MKLHYIITIYIISIFSSCNNSAKEHTISNTPQSESMTTTDSPDTNLSEYTNNIVPYYEKPRLEDISKTIGVVKVLYYEYIEELKQKVEILNLDGSLWGLVDLHNGDFYGDEILMPRIAKVDYGTILFTCIAETDSSYTIIVNERIKETKILPKKEFFKLETWEEHIKDDCLISFEETEWAVYDKPLGNRVEDRMRFITPHEDLAEYEDYNDGYFEDLTANLKILEVEGEWMKIECTTCEGWVRWKKDNVLQFTIYYLM